MNLHMSNELTPEQMTRIRAMVASIVHAEDRLWDSLIVKEPKIEDARTRGTETYEALRAYLSEPNGIVRRPTGNRAQRRKQLALARKGGAL